MPRVEAHGDTLVDTARNVAPFSVAADGTLRHLRTHPFERAAGDLLWMNVVA